MPTYRLLIEYNGAAFHGWQVQKSGPSVQGAIEDALAVLFREPIAVVGAGRTDAGVHARGQVAHFRREEEVDVHRLQRALNGMLPREIAILSAEPAPERFHARYDAFRREYHYGACTVPRALERHLRWYLRPAPDFDRMNAAAGALLGRHHFGAFCRAQSETENRVCTLERARWLPEARPGDWRFEIAADRFLHGMVRAIVGTLVQIGQGRRDPAEIGPILESRDRRRAGPAAPAHGLVLHAVSYPDAGAPGRSA